MNTHDQLTEALERIDGLIGERAINFAEIAKLKAELEAKYAEIDALKRAIESVGSVIREAIKATEADKPKPPTGRYLRCYASKHRDELYRCASVSANNAFGLLLWESKDGQRMPVTCEHGGSMWLCWNCLNKIVDDEKAEGRRVETIIP